MSGIVKFHSRKFLLVLFSSLFSKCLQFMSFDIFRYTAIPHSDFAHSHRMFGNKKNLHVLLQDFNIFEDI